MAAMPMIRQTLANNEEEEREIKVKNDNLTESALDETKVELTI